MRTYVDEAMTLRPGQMVLIRLSIDGTEYVGEVKSVERDDSEHAAWVTLHSDAAVWYEHAGAPVPAECEPCIFVTPTTQVFPQ